MVKITNPCNECVIDVMCKISCDQFKLYTADRIFKLTDLRDYYGGERTINHLCNWIRAKLTDPIITIELGLVVRDPKKYSLALLITSSKATILKYRHGEVYDREPL